MSQEYAVKTENLNFWYGNFQALKNINLNIAEGKITSLIGPSGCGKSTFLKCLNRINERNGNTRVEGKIQIFDRNIFDPEVNLEMLRKDVGMVFQRPNPLPISIYDNIAFGYRTHFSKKEYKKKLLEDLVVASLKRVKLWDTVEHTMWRSALKMQLGEQQKLCIARLLPLKPKLILLDEPCSALDPWQTESIEELLRELRGEYTMVIVTHNMAQAKRVSDNAIFMLMGEIVESGPTQELFNNPKEIKTRNYIEGRYG